jgi:hypothetical protein
MQSVSTIPSDWSTTYVLYLAYMMRKVKEPTFTDRETRSTRRSAKEPQASSEPPPADVGLVDPMNNSTKRKGKGKGKATDSLRKKPRLPDEYLDPFVETNLLLVPELSITPA